MAGEIETPAPDKAGTASRWINEIDVALKREQPWRTRSRKVVKRYRDERKDARGSGGQSRINILWSNTEVLKAALYSSTAEPDVRRRFPDATNANAASRAAADILERSLSYCADVYDVDAPVEAALEDVLLPGRGVAWVVYDPKIEGEGDDGKVTEQPLRVEYVYWEDYAQGLARKWEDVPWIARRHAYTKKQFENEFPDADGGPKFDYEMKDASGRNMKASEQDADKVEVWEIWYKAERQRIYVGRGYLHTLKETEDPLGLNGFWPAPRPMHSVKTNDTMIPVPEFSQYQDQAGELDDLSTRINVLIGHLRWKGIYDGSVDGENMLENLASADDGEFLPYENWMALKDKGGIEAAVGFWPMEKIVVVLERLYIERATLIQTIYEITGISDIIRGSTDPRETKGAQKLKAQFGSIRMQSRQKDVERFIRDLYRIKAEIIAEHFTVETLAAITGMELPTEEDVLQAKTILKNAEALARQVPQEMQQQALAQVPPEVKQAVQKAQEIVSGTSWKDVMGILRSDKRRGYRIDVETDATAFVDQEQEKKQRLEFLQVMQELLPGAYQAAIVAPSMLPLIKEIVLIAVRSFKAGRVAEEAIEDAFDDLEKNPPQMPTAEGGKEPGDSQDLEKAKGLAAIADIKRKLKRDDAEIEIEREGAKHQASLDEREAGRQDAESAATIEKGERDTELKERARMATALARPSQRKAA